MAFRKEHRFWGGSGVGSAGDFLYVLELFILGLLLFSVS